MKDGLASQRIVELLLELLLTDRGRTKADLRSLPGYSNLDDAAFETAFQRDKDTLTGVGVKLDMGDQVPPRYRVLHMPDGPNLTSADVALAGHAVGAWQHQDSSAPSAIISKLLALTPDDVDPGPSVPVAHIEGDERTFQQVLEALRTGACVTFQYQKLGGPLQRRQVKPLRLVLSGAGTYLHGFDLDRGAVRLFRLTRMEGPLDNIACTDSAGGMETLNGDALPDGASPIDLVSPTLWVRESTPAASAMGQWSDPVPGEAPSGWVRRAGVAAWQGTWIRRILSQGTDIVPVAPASFVRFTRSLLERADHA